MTKPITARLARKLSLFKKEEDGSIVVLTLFLIIAMIFTAGIAVDMMRFETYRARLQSTIDRAVLAAADLDTCLARVSPNGAYAVDPADIVNDYMRINGFEGQVQSINVERDDSSCAVTADARIDVNTIFMKLIGYGEINTGVQELGAGVSSGATESIENVEVSLVLDVSGSMRGTKIEQLRDAASDFVELVSGSVDPERLSMSIVPYSTQVNLGPDLYSQYRVSHRHDYSYCLDLPDTVYNTTSVDPLTRYPQAGHFDADGGASYSSLRTASYWTCNPEPTSWVMPFTNDLPAMQDHIMALEADAWTSIEMGANWGVALLDPESQVVAQRLANAGMIDPSLSNRPAPFNTEETLKVMVLMTDGENTRDYVLSTSHRHQFSDVWYAWHMDYDDDGDFNGDSHSYETSTTVLRTNPNLRGVQIAWDESVEDRTERQFFVQDREPDDFDGDGRFGERYYWVEGIYVDHDANTGTWLRRDDSPPVWTNDVYGARQLWDDIWARFTVRTHAWNFRGDQTNDFGQYNAWYNDIVTVTYGAEKDARLDSICTVAKEEGIVIFTIGFEVTDRAADVMSGCASSPNHFYRVEGLEIANAFNSIANQISALRLFQ